jgi:hypothetical protein
VYFERMVGRVMGFFDQAIEVQEGPLVQGLSAFKKVPLLRNVKVASYLYSLITPPEVANTGPGANRGSGGGARGCGFEERVGVYARTEGGHFL